ncbi:SMI1/KNR4 family protein [Tenacibaculum sp. 190524A05c]|uniref:SMI1/KNR4 family protein n=1 Tax=Tenacibaculum platacis TaxID=3137852 RepID=UPI0031FA797F
MGKFTLKAFIVSALLIAVMGFMYLKSKDTSKSLEDNVSDKMLIKKAKEQIDSIKQSSKIEDSMMELIISLADDHSKHKNVGAKLSDEEISQTEEKLNKQLPESYKLFLKYFGDGADLVYNTPIYNSKKVDFLSNQFDDIKEELQLDSITFQSKNLLSFTKKNNDNGAWYWVTDTTDNKGEWSLVYYDYDDKTIKHMVKTLPEWMTLLVSSKNTVVSKLQNHSTTSASSSSRIALF